MVQVQLKLRLTRVQERELGRWLFHLTAVWNWAVRKIELNASDKIYFSNFEFQNLLAGHSKKLGIPSHVLHGVLATVHESWSKCFKKVSGRPRLKGSRNKLNSIPFPDAIANLDLNKVSLPGIGQLTYHSQLFPAGRIKCGRVIRRASGWYLCLFVDAEPNRIDRKAFGAVGLDPGFSSLITTSEGEIIDHPRELEMSAKRLAQAQRGHNKRLVARIQERISNQRKNRNHKLSRRLIAENILIAFSKDNTKGIARRFGKSVASSGHSQLRGMLAYKSPKSGTQYLEVDSKFSTMTCNECGAHTGPSGLAGLSVRQWRCPCGAEHDRDINAARNTLIAAAGSAVGVLESQKFREEITHP